MKKEVSQAINIMRGVAERLERLHSATDKKDAEALISSSNKLAALNAELIQNEELVAQLSALADKLDGFVEDAGIAGSLLERRVLVATEDVTTAAGEYRVAPVPQDLIDDTDDFLDNGAAKEIAPDNAQSIEEINQQGYADLAPSSDVRPEDFGEESGSESADS